MYLLNFTPHLLILWFLWKDLNSSEGQLTEIYNYINQNKAVGLLLYLGISNNIWYLQVLLIAVIIPSPRAMILICCYLQSELLKEDYRCAQVMLQVGCDWRKTKRTWSKRQRETRLLFFRGFVKPVTVNNDNLFTKQYSNLWKQYQ